MEFTPQTPPSSARVHSHSHRRSGAAPPVTRSRGGVDVTEGLARLTQDPSRRQPPIRVSPKVRHRRMRASGILLVVLVLVGLLASRAGSAGEPLARGAETVSSKPALALSTTIGHTVAVPGSAPIIPWPSTGQSAIAVPEAGLLETSGPETPLPIASLTKMMTAYLTLLEHPLTATSSGPKITLTEADQQEYDLDTTEDASSVEVKAGEVLTERQLLSGMIVRSANNLADTAARWDTGSIPAFVARMNAEAASLGMTSTHYTDTNGLDSGTSVSTASDQLILARRALQLPSFASIVDLPTVTLPVAGTIYNYVTAVGTDGVIGVKSGFTFIAMSCVVLAAVRQVGGRQVIVLAADLAQPQGLYYAGQEDISMIDAVASGLHPVTVASAHQIVGSLYIPGQSSSGARSVEVETSTTLTTVAWPGSNVVVSVQRGRISQSVQAGDTVGILEASSAGGLPISAPLVAVASLHQ